MLDLAIYRRALEFAGNSGHFQDLAGTLGMEATRSPINYLEDADSEISRCLKNFIVGLYRDGSYHTPSGDVALWTAHLDAWGKRSADRDRIRRRVAKTLVELAPIGDRRVIVAFTAKGEDECELVLPKVRENQSLGTVRAIVRRSDPTHHHLLLLRDIAIQPGESLAAISRRWNDAFSVEAVAKKFYMEFKALRNRVLQELIDCNAREPLICRNSDPTVIRRYVSKNLGRILFLWFLQAKGWLDGDRHYFVNLYERNCRGNKNHQFFRDTLVPLFFEALAKRPAQRSSAARELGDLPFLNGGLFLTTPFEDELYGEDREHINVVLPNELFDPRMNTDQTPTVLGLLRSYRFTTRESTPDDLSVDPDPELLGKVFENLNEPDDRAKTGTFYTPREIVRFMCRQTLDAYLQKQAGTDQPTLDWLRQEALDPELSDRHLSRDEWLALYNAGTGL